MPDSNKMQALDDVHFRVLPTCRTCQQFEIGACSNWGTCAAVFYKHKKHTGKSRHPSVPSNGWCLCYEIAPAKLNWLGAHRQFFDADGISV